MVRLITQTTPAAPEPAVHLHQPAQQAALLLAGTAAIFSSTLASEADTDDC